MSSGADSTQTTITQPGGTGPTATEPTDNLANALDLDAVRSEVTSSFDLTGRTAIITGASRGIGRAIAETFAAQGAAVVIASRKADACDAVARSINDGGGRALSCPTHMGEPDDVSALVAGTVDHFGGVDIVVNNAANPLAQQIGAMTPGAMEKSWATNFRGPVMLVQEALPHLRASDHASVINVTTAGVYTTGAFVSLYVAAKSAMTAMTRSMASELAGDGIRVNAIAPGTVATDMVLNTPEEFQQAAVAAQLIRRMGAPEEIARPALLLASDAGSFMTGHTVIVDGGMTVH